VAQPAGREPEVVLWFVEQFALVLAGAGMPRMAARVFAYLLTDEADQCTAGEFATGLRMSPAAVSGAVRQLVQDGLVIRDREPGASADSYRLCDDVWRVMTERLDDSMKRTENLLADGAAVLEAGQHDPTGVREALNFFRFCRAELPLVTQRWQEFRNTMRAAEGRAR
jgi:DNA-binding transcriptional regulator GbsR (MarR family)